ncbi:MAG: hypothetical protein CL891_01255 [Dehalococcoidia bacterium]|nr:hypothetical protein [Dehalococcoidia bacterium]
MKTNNINKHNFNNVGFCPHQIFFIKLSLGSSVSLYIKTLLDLLPPYRSPLIENTLWAKIDGIYWAKIE